MGDVPVTVVICPNCQKRLRLRGAAGGRTRCPNPACGQPIEIPAAEDILVGEVEEDEPIVGEVVEDEIPVRPPRGRKKNRRPDADPYGVADSLEERLRRREHSSRLPRALAEIGTGVIFLSASVVFVLFGQSFKAILFALGGLVCVVIGVLSAFGIHIIFGGDE